MYAEARTRLRGLVLNQPTPYKPGTLEVDHDGLRRNIEHWIANRVPVIMITAGTSDFASLSEQEIYDLTRTTVEAVRRRAFVIACTGLWWLGQTIRFARYCLEVGADALMVIKHEPANASAQEIYWVYKDILPADQKKLEEVLPGYDAYIIELGLRLPAELIAKCKRLKLVAALFTGTDHIDCKALEKAGIRLMSLKNETELLSKVSATAEQAWGLMLALLRHIPHAFESVKRGEWGRLRRGCVAHAVSRDGFHWQLRGPLYAPAHMDDLEVPALLKHGGLYYLSSYINSARPTRIIESRRHQAAPCRQPRVRRAFNQRSRLHLRGHLRAEERADRTLHRKWPGLVRAGASSAAPRRTEERRLRQHRA